MSAFRKPRRCATGGRQSLAIGAGTVAVVATLLLLFRALISQFRRLARSEASLAQHNEEQEATRLRLERQAEALRRSEADAEEKSAALQTTLEFMDQGIMMVNADRIVEVCNAHAMQMLDLPAELMTARPHFADVVAWQWKADEFAVTPEQHPGNSSAPAEFWTSRMCMSGGGRTGRCWRFAPRRCPAAAWCAPTPT